MGREHKASNGFEEVYPRIFGFAPLRAMDV
jgi:hypothetical protein